MLQARATVTTIASGLVNPRGLNFGPDGALYVAEAGSGGSGPCILGSDGLVKCYGTTGAVTKIVLGGPASRVVTGLPSIAALPGTMGAGIATGPHDVDFQGTRKWVRHYRLWSGPGQAAGSGIRERGPPIRPVSCASSRMANGLSRKTLAGFENDKNPDGVDPPDSNPYGVLAGPGRTIYTDAGGNSLNAVAANGSISNLAVFPRGAAPFPPFQAVPTSVAVGPDGALYVGQLTGGPFPIGAARVYRVPANGGPPTAYAEGFTKIIDIAFGKDGSLYVLEISAVSGAGVPPFAPPGALLRVPPGGGTPVDITPAVPGVTGFPTPGGIAVGSDGALYITLNSISPTAGAVIKVVL